MPRRAFVAATATVLVLLAGMVVGLPMVSGQAAPATVIVKIPPGSGSTSAASEQLPGYSPDSVTVVIGVNNTVMWENNDTVSGVGTAHTVTDVTQPSGGGFVGSGNLPVNKSYSFTFTVPGTYQYDCSYHAWMKGTVIVLAASTSSTTHTTPEFPAAALAVILFAVLAAVMVAAPRLRPKLSANVPASPPV
jgi:plastocyanin